MRELLSGNPSRNLWGFQNLTGLGLKQTFTVKAITNQQINKAFVRSGRVKFKLWFNFACYHLIEQTDATAINAYTPKRMKIYPAVASNIVELKLFTDETTYHQWP
jgi:hypothetical protein